LFKNSQPFQKNYQKTSGGKFFLAHPVYCKLSKCIGQTPCSYEHYLVTKSVGGMALLTGDVYRVRQKKVDP